MCSQLHYQSSTRSWGRRLIMLRTVAMNPSSEGLNSYHSAANPLVVQLSVHMTCMHFWDDIVHRKPSVHLCDTCTMQPPYHTLSITPPASTAIVANSLAFALCRLIKPGSSCSKRSNPSCIAAWGLPLRRPACTSKIHQRSHMCFHHKKAQER